MLFSDTLVGELDQTYLFAFDFSENLAPFLESERSRSAVGFEPSGIIDREKLIRRKLARRISDSLICSLTTRPLSDLAVVRNKYGGLYDNGRQVYFNRSYSDSKFMLALRKQGAVGIDIERISPLSDDQKAIMTMLASREQKAALLLPEDERAEYLFQIWTRKEAFGKCTGRGLFENLRRIELGTSKSYLFKAQKYFFVDLKLFSGFTLSLVTRAAFSPVKLFEGAAAVEAFLSGVWRGGIDVF